MKDRILQLMQSQHMNQQAFSNKTGIAPATLSNIFSGRTRPTLPHVEALVSSFPTISLKWLLSGEGEMFVDSTPGNTGADLFGNSDTRQQGNGTSATDNMSEHNNQSEELDLFSVGQNSIPQQNTPRVANIPQRDTRTRVSNQDSYRSVQSVNIPNPGRKITEIRLYYDDQTWECFVPKK